MDVNLSIIYRFDVKIHKGQDVQIKVILLRWCWLDTI